MRPRDYKVDFKTEDEIARIAAEVRTKLGFDDVAKLDMVGLFTQLFGKPIGKKGVLNFEIFDHHPDDRPAEVSFNPLTLRVHRETWNFAKLGDPHGRFILAHELGHVLMHTAEAKAFTGKEGEFGIYGFEESSGEWQADVFAGHLLVPDGIVLQIQDPAELARHCDVERKLSSERIRSAKRRKLIKPRVEGDLCRSCGDLLMSDGRCSNCGKLR